MKKIFFLLLLLSFWGAANVVAQSFVHTELANHIAQKLKDSLSLSGAQKDSLYAINLLLSDQKSSLRAIYQHSDTLQLYTQRVEHSRDSLYRPVLGEEKYQLYKQKKRHLLSAD